MLVLIGTDCTGSCKSNYHTTTTTHLYWYIVLLTQIIIKLSICVRVFIFALSQMLILDFWIVSSVVFFCFSFYHTVFWRCLKIIKPKTNLKEKHCIKRKWQLHSSHIRTNWTMNPTTNMSSKKSLAIILDNQSST